MDNFQIATLDVEVTIQELKDYLDKATEKYENDTGFETKYTLTNMQSANGKQLVEVNIDVRSSDKATIYAELNTVGNVHFKGINFISLPKGFYKSDSDGTSEEGTQDDPSQVIHEFLKIAAKAKKGTYGAVNRDGGDILIHGGKEIKIMRIAFVDVNDKVYYSSLEGVTETKATASFLDDNDVDSLEVNIDGFILDWITKNPTALAAWKDATMDIGDKLDIVGLELIKEKMSGQLTAKEFVGYFLQASSLGMANKIQQVAIFSQMLTDANNNEEE